MNPAVLARLFQAQTDTLHAAQQSEAMPAPGLSVQQEPGALWPGTTTNPEMGYDQPPENPAEREDPNAYGPTPDDAPPLGAMFGPPAPPPTMNQRMRTMP